jgi:transposase
VEPTGTYHQAVATFLEQQGALVTFVSNHVAHLNRRTLDGTWDKNDPKDAHNLGDLLEQGKVLFYSLPDEPLGALRHLVRLLRRARAEQSACKARFATTLLPQLGPMGDPLPAARLAALPALLQRLVPPARRGRAAAGVALPAGVAAACADLAAQLAAVQARITGLEAALVRVAEPLPAYRLLRTIPGVGPTVAAILVAEIGDIAWYTHFAQLRKLAGLDIIALESGQYRGRGRISKAGRALLRWALYQAALGAARTRAGRAWLDALRAKRAGDRYAFFKAAVELAAKLLRIVWGVWRSGRPYDPARALGALRPPPAAPAPRRATPAARRRRGPAPAVRLALVAGADRVRFALRETAPER